MRLSSWMGAAALLKAATLVLCLVGGRAEGGGDGISQRVKSMVAKMVRLRCVARRSSCVSSCCLIVRSVGRRPVRGL